MNHLIVILIITKDVSSEKPKDVTEALITEEGLTNSDLSIQIADLKAQIEYLTINTPIYEEMTQVQEQVVVIHPETMDEFGNVIPAVTSVESVSVPVSNNQAEIDVHNAQIMELQNQLAQLQAQTTFEQSVSITENSVTSESSSEEIVEELPYIRVKLNSKVDTYTTSQGQIVIEKLPKSQYYFVEVEAPKGYILDKDTKYKFEITGKKTETIVVNVENEPEKPGIPVEPKPESTTTTAEETTTKPGGNTPPSGGGGGKGGKNLPSTGESENNLVLAGLALMAASAVFITRTRKSN